MCKCRICKKEILWRGYCKDCMENRKEDIKIYENKLESRRKYKRGKRIWTIEQFDKCSFIYWHNQIKHVEFVKSWQYRIVLKAINNGWFYEAIKKEELNG